MALNFGLLDPDAPAKIAGSVYAGQQARQENALAQQRLQAGTQQLETGRLQQQESQMKMDQMVRDREALAQLQKTFVANGKSPDLETNFNAMIQSGIPHFVDIGTSGLQKLQQQKQFAAIMGGGTQPAAAAQPFQPSAAPGALGSGTFDLTAPAKAAPVNALAPAAAVAPAPTNALAGGQDLQQRINAAYAVGTPAALAWAKAQEERMKPIHGAAGGFIYDPTSRSFQQAPEKTPVAAPTTLAKLQSELAALPPGDVRRKDYEALIRKETTHAPAISNTIVAEKAESGAFGKMLVDQYSDLSKAANLAAKTLPSIESNLNILNKGLDTGFGTEAKAAGAKILGALGVQNAEKYATDTQTFQSNALQAVLQKQLEQKGPQTESDAQRIQQIGPQLGKTKKANEFYLTVAQEQLRRDMEQRKFYTDWRNKTGSFNGAEDAWFSGEGGRSIFDRPSLKSYGTGPSVASQIPTGAPATVPGRAIKPAVALTSADQQALNWANSNPTDPRASQIKQRLGQ